VFEYSKLFQYHPCADGPAGDTDAAYTIKKENAQLINGKLGENHITKQTPHGAAPTHDTLENNRAQTRKHHSNKTRRLGEHYGEEETGVLESHTGQEHCLSKLAYSRAFTNLARYSGDEKMQRFRA
jgi:hypothetical protein